MLLGDFNSEPIEKALTTFSQIHILKNLINEVTSYKNTNKPSCIDLILTNRPRSFQNSCALETGLSDFHNMTLTVLKVLKILLKKKKKSKFHVIASVKCCDSLLRIIKRQYYLNFQKR